MTLAKSRESESDTCQSKEKSKETIVKVKARKNDGHKRKKPHLSKQKCARAIVEKTH